MIHPNKTRETNEGEIKEQDIPLHLESQFEIDHRFLTVILIQDIQVETRPEIEILLNWEETENI